jgi:hypothetical protein
MSKYRVELTRENQSRLEQAAKKDGRTMVKQLNHILDQVFNSQPTAATKAK